MPKVAPIQTSFNAGEWSPLMDGHVNIASRASSVRLLQNMIALKQGPIVRRGGTKYAAGIKASANRTALIPFEFSTTQAYIIEIGDQYLRFFRNNAQIESGGSPYEISSPYAQAALFNSDNILQVQYAQSADVLYTIHGSYKPYAVTRTGHTAWTATAMTFNDGPYLDINTTATTLTLSGTSGSVTVTASASLFASTDVGRLIRWKDPANNWTWLTITAYTSATQVTATISGPNASAGTATTNWRLGVYSDTTGWPTTITFFQNRLVLAGCASYPDRWDMTRSGGYSATTLFFAPSDANGTVTDDAAITGTLQSGAVNKIQWMAPQSQGLLIGTTSQEWIVRASNTNEVVTPTNAKADPTDDKGGAYVKPILTEGGVLFLQNARRRLHFMGYSFEQDRVKADDLNLFSEHITRNRVISMAYQQEPVNVIWALRNDGVLAGLTFYPDQQVVGWHRHIIGGVSDADGAAAIVESIAVIPSADGSRDELWMIVQRYIDGATVRYVEYMTRYYEDDIAQEDAFHVDCGLTYDGAAVSQVLGLDHLEGQTVKVMVDGRSHPDRTVQSGVMVLANNRTGSVIQVGLPNVWAVQTQRPEAGAADGTAQGKIKRVVGLVVRLLNTLGLKYGPNADTLDEYDFGQGDGLNETTPLYSGDTESLAFPDGYNIDGYIYLTHDGVFPAAILAVMPQMTTYDR